MEKALERINAAGLILLDDITPKETYRVIVEQAMNLMDAEYGSILLGNGEQLLPVYVSDNFFHSIKVRKNGTLEQSYKNKKLIVNHITSKTKVNSLIKKVGIQSVILIPLSYHGNSIGVLSVLSLKKEHFSKKQIDMLRVFGSMASLAIKKAQLHNETTKALEIRDMFISMAAHELRTPLTSISGYIQLLHSKLSNRDDVTGKWIDALNEENKRMMLLVKEILEVNRMKAGQLQFRWQECELDDLVRESINITKKIQNSRLINYKNYLKSDSKIVGDSERLTQAVVNVLDNALKYSPSDSPVEITLKKEGKGFNLSIKDFGKGIDEKDLPNIFDGHHVGGSGEEGFGWGLFFVENVIRQHRGVINIESRMGKGTTIKIILPKAIYSKNK